MTVTIISVDEGCRMPEGEDPESVRELTGEKFGLARTATVRRAHDPGDQSPCSEAYGDLVNP
jgi:hypothetical protein